MQEREDVAGCDGAGADDGLGFVLEVGGFFDVGVDGWVGEDVVEDVGLANGFETLKCVSASNFIRYED